MLVSPEIEEPHLLVGVVAEIVDGTGESIARRFGYAYVDATGQVRPAGPAPYLDCVAAPRTPAVVAATRAAWLGAAESRARTWIIGHQLRQYLAEVSPRRLAELERTRKRVDQRLTYESAKPPRVMTAALVLPLAMVETEIPADAPIHAKETRAVERRGIEQVVAAERALGREPQEQPFNNPGYDILSVPAGGGPSICIEVKARAEVAEDFYVTHNEVVTGKNAVPHYRLALVTVSTGGPEYDEVRYVADPFAGVDFGDLAATGIRASWTTTWAAGTAPF